MKTINRKDCRIFIDDELVIMWNPIIDKVNNTCGIICYRNSQDNSVLGLFHVLVNKNNFVGQVKLIDDDNSEINLNVDKFYAEVIK